MAKKGRKLTINGYVKDLKYNGQITRFVEECEPGEFHETDFPKQSECNVHRIQWTGPKGYKPTRM